MAGSQKNFSWSPGQLQINVTKLPSLLERLVTAATEYHGTRGEALMRRTATWRDRTGNARSGLVARVTHSPKVHTITFAHSVPYGIWLEVRWAGRYAVIGKSVRTEGAAVMKTLNKAMARIR